jgi:hypothetical protein
VNWSNEAFGSPVTIWIDGDDLFRQTGCHKTPDGAKGR